MKACLFLVAGGVRYRTGIWDLPHFGGLGRHMPWTMAAFVVAALGMIGIPPTAGFFSKWYLLQGGIELGNWVFVLVILASTLLSAVYFFRVMELIYTKPLSPKVELSEGSDPPAGMLGPILILAGGVLFLGLINSIIVTQVLEIGISPLG
jgi:multicomponent Na+:H+ antiporter subunit D